MLNFLVNVKPRPPRNALPCALNTNDKALRRVEEVPIVLLDELSS